MALPITIFARVAAKKIVERVGIQGAFKKFGARFITRKTIKKAGEGVKDFIDKLRGNKKEEPKKPPEKPPESESPLKRVLSGFKDFTAPTTYSEYYNTQREKFWDARGSGRDIEAAYRVAYTWLENQLNDIETYIDMIEEYDETVQEKIKRAKEVCETVLNELETAYTMGLDAVVKYEQSER